MHCIRSLALALVFALTGPAIAGRADDATRAAVPPLADPASGLRIPGKVIWADLFTSDVSEMKRYYGGVFGWKWRWVNETAGKRYGLFLDEEGGPVAGVVEIDAPEPGVPYARWVYFLSADDVDASSAKVVAEGGRVLIPARDVAARGRLAVVADPEGAPFGLLRSSSGDPPDVAASAGEWLWTGLVARDADGAAGFYSSLLGYELRSREDASEAHDHILIAGEYWRVGISELLPDSENAPTWVGFVRVDDLAAAASRARELGGGEIFVTESTEPGKAIALFDDPFGAPFGFLPWDHAADTGVQELPR